MNEKEIEENICICGHKQSEHLLGNLKGGEYCLYGAEKTNGFYCACACEQYKSKIMGEKE